MNYGKWLFMENKKYDLLQETNKITLTSKYILHSFARQRMQANERGLMPCLYHLGIKDMHIGPAKSVKFK